jgi:hypothetical protein
MADVADHSTCRAPLAEEEVELYVASAWERTCRAFVGVPVKSDAVEVCFTLVSCAAYAVSGSCNESAVAHSIDVAGRATVCWAPPVPVLREKPEGRVGVGVAR